MSKLFDELKEDLNFVKSHSLQPKWYKILKVFILLGFLACYYFLFGLLTTLIFIAIFFLLSAIVHITYRVKTKKWKQSWLDFIVVEENHEIKPKSIGKFYYSAIVLNAILSIMISQALT
jgi:hypothetical protein